jgi:hypothetical protein
MTTPTPGVTAMNTLLKAAGVAYPEYEWELINGMLFRSTNPDAKQKIHGVFDIEKDWPALQIELEDHKNGGWMFWRGEDGTFRGRARNDNEVLIAPTKPELLLKIVEVLP